MVTRSSVGALRLHSAKVETFFALQLAVAAAYVLIITRLFWSSVPIAPRRARFDLRLCSASPRAPVASRSLASS